MDVVDNTKLKTLQFELWQECNNHCVFCYLRAKGNRKTPDELKLKSLQETLKSLNNDELIKEYGCIGFIGGEFFQGQLKNLEVRETFMKVFQKTADLYNEGRIKAIWIPATLTIGHQEDLFKVIAMFNDPTNVWVITSWDTIGRFKTSKMEKSWHENIAKLHELFPNLKINVTTILTGDVIDRYMRDEFIFRDLAEKWNVNFFFKQCGNFVDPADGERPDENIVDRINCNKVLPNFFPRRKQFLDFLIKYKNQETEILWDKLFNIKYRADDLVRHFNDGKVVKNHRFKNEKKEVDDVGESKCGHPLVYKAYCDSEECCLCDKLKIALASE